jgi:hypothetical protein
MHTLFESILKEGLHINTANALEDAFHFVSSEDEDFLCFVFHDFERFVYVLGCGEVFVNESEICVMGFLFWDEKGVWFGF